MKNPKKKIKIAKSEEASNIANSKMSDAEDEFESDHDVSHKHHNTVEIKKEILKSAESSSSSGTRKIEKNDDTHTPRETVKDAKEFVKEKETVRKSSPNTIPENADLTEKGKPAKVEMKSVFMTAKKDFSFEMEIDKVEPVKHTEKHGNIEKERRDKRL